MLLETLRVAASLHRREARWSYAKAEGCAHVVDVTLPRADHVQEDPLAAFVPVRSVERGPMRMTPLTLAERTRLTAALGPDLDIVWHESLMARARASLLNALATDIRLRIPEAFTVHRAALDWHRAMSPDQMPVGTLGLDRASLAVLRWSLVSWRRMEVLNRVLGTGIARLQFDVLPGLACAAHFDIRVPRPLPSDDDERGDALLRAGARLQRFWLTATMLGLALQPTMAALVFAHYGRRGAAFTAAARIRRRASMLAARLDKEGGGAPEMIFRGRIGVPRERRLRPRSTRRPLSELMQPWEGTAWPTST
jgi:hypothetical protein